MMTATTTTTTTTTNTNTITTREFKERNHYYIKIGRNHVIPLLLILHKQSTFTEYYFQELIISIQQLIVNTYLRKNETLNALFSGGGSSSDRVERPKLFSLPNFNYSYKFVPTFPRYYVVVKKDGYTSPLPPPKRVVLYVGANNTMLFDNNDDNLNGDDGSVDVDDDDGDENNDNDNYVDVDSDDDDDKEDIINVDKDMDEKSKGSKKRKSLDDKPSTSRTSTTSPSSSSSKRTTKAKSTTPTKPTISPPKKLIAEEIIDLDCGNDDNINNQDINNIDNTSNNNNKKPKQKLIIPSIPIVLDLSNEDGNKKLPQDKVKDGDDGNNDDDDNPYNGGEFEGLALTTQTLVIQTFEKKNDYLLISDSQLSTSTSTTSTTNSNNKKNGGKNKGKEISSYFK